MHPSRATGHLATFELGLRGPPDHLTLALPDGLGEGRIGVDSLGLGVSAMNDQAKTRQAVSAAVIGNVLEWYDFSVYAFVAVVLSRKFFPPGDEVTALLSTFLAYGLGFVARPLGGIVIGRVGDTHGRKTALLITIALMAIGTVLVGILPTYAAIGIAAPLLLVAARLMQGFSAGGEWGGSTAYIVEWAPAGQRGFYGSFQQMSVVAGLLLGSAVAAIFNTMLTPDQMSDWGWRVPFLLGGILGPVGLWMRRTIDETPAYRKAVATPVPAAAGEATPLVTATRAFGFTIVWTVCFYVLLSYMPTWSQTYMKISPAAALWANTFGLVILVIAIPFMGIVSDRIGRKPLLLGCCAFFVIVPFPLFKYLLASGGSFATLLYVQILFAIAISMFSGPGPAAIAEMFPTRTRSTWMTTGYALAVAIFGGFAPLISVWLITRFEEPTAPTFYLMAAAVVSILVIYGLRETAHEELG
jgi:MHS family proline/betaine transporter-like MFS transporter